MVRKLLALPDRLRGRLAQDDGFALVLALGVSAVLGLLGATVVTYGSANYGAASRSKDDQGAFALAEAGINNAMAVLSNPTNNALDPTLLPPATSAYEGGTVTWSGALDRATAVWTLTSTGERRNPTGPGAEVVRRTVSAEVPVTPIVTWELANEAWNSIVATRTGTTCDMNVSSGVTEASPLYVMGNLCLASGAKITGGPLVVKRKLSLANTDSAVGSLAAPIGEAHVGVGCKYYTQHWHPDATHPTHPFCSAVDNVHATILDSSLPALTPPAVDWDTWYRNAIPGPFQSCTTAAGTTPVFEDETTSPARNNSVPTVFNLTPPASYTCRVGPADRPSGELSWDASTRVLKVSGTIFIDGSAKVEGGSLYSYDGQATLYLSGTFLVSSSSKLCATVSGSDCDFAGWNPNSELLTVVANGSGGQVNSGNSIQLGSYAQFQGALQGTQAVQVSNYGKIAGPMIGSTVILGSSVVTYSFPEIVTAPVAIPGNPIVFAQASPPQLFSG